MAFVENADLKLTLTVYADELDDLVALVRDAAKEIKHGNLAGNVGGCLGSYHYEVVERNPQRHRTQHAPDPTEQGGEYCVCEKPFVEKGFCFVCQSPVAPRPKRSVGR